MRTLLSILVLTMTITGCGKIHPQTKKQSQAVEKSPLSDGSCTQSQTDQFISIYNGCENAWWESELIQCDQQLANFQQQYPNIDCSINNEFHLNRPNIDGYRTMIQKKIGPSIY